MLCKVVLILGQFLRIYTSRFPYYIFKEVRIGQTIGSNFELLGLLERLASGKPNFVCIIMLYSAGAATF